MAAKTRISVALLLLWGAIAFGADSAPPGGGSMPSGKGAGYRLDEVRIIGSSDRPAVLFFLPRGRLRLIPMRIPDLDVKNRLLTDDKAFKTTE